MNSDPREVTGICGLFCETCPAYIAEMCSGCLSDHVADFCKDCRHGFRDCAKEHKVTWCNECGDFPCDRLRKFKDCHIEDGISHHEHIMDYVSRQRETGVEAWVKEMEEKCACPDCGTINIWYARKCRTCGRSIR